MPAQPCSIKDKAEYEGGKYLDEYKKIKAEFLYEKLSSAVETEVPNQASPKVQSSSARTYLSAARYCNSCRCM